MLKKTHSCGSVLRGSGVDTDCGISTKDPKDILYADNTKDATCKLCRKINGLIPEKRTKREIIFRGKRTDGGGWMEGSLLSHADKPKVVIVDSDNESHVCFAETVGQFTGKDDKEKIKIFEGDICSDGDEMYEIMFMDGAFVAIHGNVIEHLEEVHDCIEVIGSIHTTP